MHALYLGNAEGTERFYLNGTGVTAPVRGAIRQAEPRRLVDGSVEEVITIECKSGDIHALITWLELRLARLENGIQTWHLWLEASPGSIPVGAPLLCGGVELLGGGLEDRLRGFQGIGLRLVRPDWLAELPQAVRLQNVNGVDVTDGLMVFNHSDVGSGHVNSCDIRADQILGSQPQPVRMKLDIGGPAVRRLGKIVIAGGIDLWDDASSFNHVLEGEAASVAAGCSANSVVSSLGASGGAYQTFQWTAGTESAICRWLITSDQLAWLNGRGLRPVARLHALPPDNTRWRWKILSLDGATQLDQSAAVALDSASQLQVLPAMFPPLPGSTAPYQSLLLEVWLECTTPGTKQIDLDFIHLFPLENFALFQPIGGIDQNRSLVMDWSSGECFTEADTSGEKSVTHRVSGSAMVLVPGRNHRMYVLYESDAGFVIVDTVRVRVEAGARWRLP